MGDVATPMLIGSAIGGLTNRDNPLQGALLGGALGGAGGAFMKPGGLSNMFSFTDDAAAGVLPSALSGSTTINAAAPMAGQAFVNPVTTAMTTGPSGVIGVEAAKTGLFGGATPLTNAAMQGQGLAQTGAMQRSLSLGMPGVEYGQGGTPTMMERFGQVGQYAQQNPVLTGMALQSAQQMMQRPEAPMAPAGQVSRGQIQGGDYMSLLNPQQSTVLRPQPISLLG